MCRQILSCRLTLREGSLRLFGIHIILMNLITNKLFMINLWYQFNALFPPFLFHFSLLRVDIQLPSIRGLATNLIKHLHIEILRKKRVITPARLFWVWYAILIVHSIGPCFINILPQVVKLVIKSFYKLVLFVNLLSWSTSVLGLWFLGEGADSISLLKHVLRLSVH